MDAPLASAAKPPTGRKMKARAPPPPGKPATPNVHSGPDPPHSGSPARPQSPLPTEEEARDSAVDVTVVLPSGLETRSVVRGSHAMMDLLVELCLQNHLNPSLHALEVRSPDTQQPLNFKPNTLVGTLDVHTVFLKEKVPEERARPGPPKVPEKSVRLVVNYLRTQKAVVRVSPEVPLQNILPVICAKCDVSPEHVVLLRDNVAGEELELSKSLSELGIKELYAWDNKRETFRKSSLGNDETDKEKKKFLGFFKVNKRSNSKVEPPRMSGADGDEDSSELALSRGANHGCLTMPNSPSVKSRSATLGPSLSLSNISGVSLRSDMKKRRAPPPPLLPGAGPPAQDRASEKVSLGSQMDLQKKKRRAPAPPPPQPPPSPLVPTRTQDQDENRRSATGVGRQVPQKPPRGTARGPPQLVLPPPPPYPPPDADVVEPPGFPGEGAAPEASGLRPTLSLPLGPGSPGGVDGAPLVTSEAEETVSVGSCFASEDTTEDSGVMSSPSDIVSLDSQHDSTRSKDKWATDQEDCSDQDLAGTPELGPQKSPSWERNGSGNWHPRPEKAAAASQDDSDPFGTGRPQHTLAELDGDLEEMEDSYETDSSSLTGSVNDVPGPHAQDVIVPESDADTIPVTFIGEVLDDPVEPAALSNSNNNAGSFAPGSAPGPPHGAGGPVRPASADRWRAVSAITAGPAGTSAPRRPGHDLRAQAPRGPPQPGEPGTAPRGEEKAASAPPSWCQRGRNPGGSFGLKYGLTTYTIVPPKSERRCYDRGVSLSTGAIKIDELGNLVSPRVSGPAALPSPLAQEEGQAPGAPAPGAPRERRATAPPPQPPRVRDAGGPPGAGGSRPPAANASPVQVPAAPAAQVPFLKPQRRTSSQYVASAIAKRIGPPRAPADAAGRRDGAGTARAGAGRGRTPGPAPPFGEGEAGRPRGDLPSTAGEWSAAGAPPRGRGGSPPGALPTPDRAAGVHGGSHAAPVSGGQSCDSGAKHSTTSGPRPGPASQPRSPGSPPPGSALLNGSRGAPVPREPPRSPRAPGTPSRSVADPQGGCRGSRTDGNDSDSTPPPSIFGPKKKFRPVVQRPVPKDTSLHSALMEAIHAAGGKDRLRKTAGHSLGGAPRKPCYTEAESEHSALLAAIRGHRGACSLRKVTSFASEELQTFRDAAESAHASGPPGLEDGPPPPILPPPAPPAAPVSRAVPRSSSGPLSNPADARQALMDAIRSGTGAARLRKVPLLV